MLKIITQSFNTQRKLLLTFVCASLYFYFRMFKKKLQAYIVCHVFSKTNSLITKHNNVPYSFLSFNSLLRVTDSQGNQIQLCPWCVQKARESVVWLEPGPGREWSVPKSTRHMEDDLYQLEVTSVHILFYFQY